MSSPATTRPVTIYWRPGCPYCSRLRRDLRAIGLPTSDINIWEDHSAAAAVRRLTGGDETVPTVMVGDRALVNPKALEVVAAAGDLVPNAISEDIRRRARLVAAASTARRVLLGVGVVAGFAAESAGRPGVGWVLWGATGALIAALGLLRKRKLASRSVHP